MQKDRNDDFLGGIIHFNQPGDLAYIIGGNRYRDIL
jgi:hypothetical protein